MSIGNINIKQKFGSAASLVRAAIPKVRNSASRPIRKPGGG